MHTPEVMRVNTSKFQSFEQMVELILSESLMPHPFRITKRMSGGCASGEVQSSVLRREASKISCRV